MLRFAALLSLVLASMPSCGGSSVREGDATGGSSATGGSATGGSFATGGSATGGSATGGSATGGSATGGSATGGSSGAAGGPYDCLDGGVRGSLRCYSTCALPPSSVGDAGECRDGSWQCPVGMVPLASCPEESCIHREEDVCCSRETGTRTHEPCDDAGQRLACPAESERIRSGSICLPDGVVATHCIDLDNMPCSNVELRCTEGSGCGTTDCVCWANPDTGEATWRCTVLVC